MIELNVHSSVRERWSGDVILGSVRFEDLKDTTTASQHLRTEIESTISELRAKGTAILDDPVVLRMRAAFKAMPDMDPSRYRPASEALIRRCLERDFVNINPIVDVNNLLSIRLRIPLGIYDLKLVSSTCWYRIGYPGETYASISRAAKNADGKLVLADASGVVGSPVSDSGRAVFRNETTHVAVVAYFPFETGTVDAARIIAEIEAEFVMHFGAKPVQRVVLNRNV